MLLFCGLLATWKVSTFDRQFNRSRNPERARNFNKTEAEKIVERVRSREQRKFCCVTGVVLRSCREEGEGIKRPCLYRDGKGERRRKEREIAISRDPEIVRRVCLECTRPSRMDVVACPSVVISSTTRVFNSYSSFVKRTPLFEACSS